MTFLFQPQKTGGQETPKKEGKGAERELRKGGILTNRGKQRGREGGPGACVPPPRGRKSPSVTSPARRRSHSCWCLKRKGTERCQPHACLLTTRYTCSSVRSACDPGDIIRVVRGTPSQSPAAISLSCPEWQAACTGRRQALSRWSHGLIISSHSLLKGLGVSYITGHVHHRLWK